MNMDYSSLINRLNKELKFSTYSEIEAALILSILHFYKIKNVKNILIKQFLENNRMADEVNEWLLGKKIEPSLFLLEKFYELNINEKERKINGAYYTPENIVSHIIKETVKDKIGTICDPACGSGAFLSEAARYLKSKTNLKYSKIFSDYIFGVDILPSNKIHTETILSLLAIINGEDEVEYKFNIHTGDSLGYDWGSKFSGFDYIVGNPPYVRSKNLGLSVKTNIKKWETGNFGNQDLYIPFFELGVNWTNKNGRIGYITPSTYLTSTNARILRRFLAKNSFVEKIVDFNGWQIFKGALTYTCIFQYCLSKIKIIHYLP
jgi:adenine-specific DNA-methyltransferase